MLYVIHIDQGSEPIHATHASAIEILRRMRNMNGTNMNCEPDHVVRAFVLTARRRLADILGIVLHRVQRGEEANEA